MNCKQCKKRFVCGIRDDLWILAERIYAIRRRDQLGAISTDTVKTPVDDLGPQFCGGQFEEEMS